MILKIGSIYSLRYTRWITNYKIYAFVLWPGGGDTKTHLLNIGAKQLNIMERTKLVRIIVQISKTPNANKLNGRVLYKIFKTYAPREISKCYRTFFTNQITGASLLNYGINKSEDFSQIELMGQSKELYDQAQRDFQMKAINWYSKRGYDMKKTGESLAGATKPSPVKEVGTDNKTPGAKPNITSGTRPATHSAIKEVQEKMEQQAQQQKEQQVNNVVKEEVPQTNKNNDDDGNNNTPVDDGSEFGY